MGVILAQQRKGPVGNGRSPWRVGGACGEWEGPVEACRHCELRRKAGQVTHLVWLVGVGEGQLGNVCRRESSGHKLF